MKLKKSDEQQLWAVAQRRCRLSDEAVRMAKELGLGPWSLIKNIPARTQQWKAPVEDWVRHLYEKRQRRAARTRRATFNSRASCSALLLSSRGCTEARRATSVSERTARMRTSMSVSERMPSRTSRSGISLGTTVPAAAAGQATISATRSHAVST